MKTIKMIADGLGLDKQRVYRYIKRNHISEAHHDAGVMWYGEAVEGLIKQHFVGNTASSEAHQSTSKAHQTASSDVVTDTLLNMFKSELDIKNKQIEELTATNRDLTAALVAAQQTAAAAQALHAGTMQTHLLVSNEVKEGTLHQPVGEGAGGKVMGLIKKIFNKKGA